MDTEIPPEVKEREGQALRELFSAAGPEKSRAALVRERNLKGGQAFIYQHVDGRRPINLERALVYSEWLGVPISAFSERLAREAAEAKGRLANTLDAAPGPNAPDANAPVVDVQLNASTVAAISQEKAKSMDSAELIAPPSDKGAGYALVQAGAGQFGPTVAVMSIDSHGVSNNYTPAGITVSEITVSAEWLSRYIGATSPGNIRLATARSSAMGETFSRGDLLLIDIGVARVEHPGVYLYEIDGDQTVGRILKEQDGSLRISFDGGGFGILRIDPAKAGFKIIGMVVHAWKSVTL